MKNFVLILFALLFIQNAALANAVKFIQVTDAHFKPNEKYRVEVLENTVKTINKEKGVSFVIFTGDNIDAAEPEYLHEFMKIVNKLNIPYYIVIGNHDVYRSNGLSKDIYLDIIREHNFWFRYRKPNYSFKKNGFLFVVVDGAKEVIPGAIGYYREDTLKWLDKKLSRNKRNKTVIFQHFPLVPVKDVPSHRVFEGEKYLEMLDKHDNVVSVIAGHIHVNGEIMRNGVYHITTPTLLKEPNVYKVITISNTKGFSPMVYTELKVVDMHQK